MPVINLLWLRCVQLLIPPPFSQHWPVALHVFMILDWASDPSHRPGYLTLRPPPFPGLVSRNTLFSIFHPAQ